MSAPAYLRIICQALERLLCQGLALHALGGHARQVQQCAHAVSGQELPAQGWCGHQVPVGSRSMPLHVRARVQCELGGWVLGGVIEQLMPPGCCGRPLQGVRLSWTLMPVSA